MKRTAIAALLTGLAFYESLRQRARAEEAEACLQLMAMGDLDEGMYEVCGTCGGEDCGWCTECFGSGLVAHHCDAD